MRFAATLLPLLILGAFSRSASQSPSLYDDWRWGTFPSHAFNAIVETPDGGVWAAGHGGIFRFDGYTWLATGLGAGAPAESVFISAGSSAMPGLLAIVHDTLYRCTADTAFTLRYPAHDAVALADGGLLIHSDDALVVYNHGSVLSFPSPPGRTVDRPRGNDLFRTSDGTVWMNRSTGLFRLHEARWVEALASPDRPLAIGAIAQDRSGHGFMSVSAPAPRRGLWEWRSDGAPHLVAHDEGDRLVSIQIGGPLGSLAVSASGSVSMVSVEHAGGPRWITLAPLPLQMRRPNAITITATGDVWAATSSGGSLFNAQQEWWNYIAQPAPNHNRIHEIVLRNNGELWLGTADGLVIVSPKGTNRLITSILGREIPDVTGIAEDSSGSMWVSSGSAFPGAFCMDSTGAWRHVAIGSDAEGARFHRIRKDLQGHLWFLGIPNAPNEPGSGPGVFEYDYKEFKHIGRREGLPSGYVYAFHAAPDGSLWFGTSVGLACRKNGRWLAWRGGTEIPLRNVFALAMDRRGDLWMADRGHGVVRLNQNGEITQFTTDDGLVDNRVWDISVDRAGDVWAATAAGLARYHDASWLSYGEATGLRTPALWPVLAHGDTVYAGTLGSGLGILDLRRCSAPPARVLNVTTNDDGDSLLLSWSALGWHGVPASAGILTRVRIDDGHWAPWSVRRSASLDSISPGNHVAHIQARNLFGEAAGSEASFAFSIPQPFFLQPIFIGAVLGLAAFATLILRRRKA